MDTISSVGVLMVYGLPGSGKSLLCKRMEMESPFPSHLIQNTQTDFDHVEFDHFLEKTKSQLLEKYGTGSEQQVDTIFFQENLFKQSRSEAYLHLENLILQHQKKAQNKPDLFTIILVDDNMFYKGMRSSVKHLVQKYEIGYAQLFLKLDLNTVLENNRQRPKSQLIPDQIIKSMHERFEFPKDHSWEKPFDFTLDLNSVKKPDIYFAFFKSQTLLLENIFHKLRHKVISEDLEKEKDRVQVKENFFHQLDLKTRKVVESILKENGALLKTNKSLGKEISILRRDFLNSLKEDDLTFSQMALEKKFQFYEVQFQEKVQILLDQK